MKDKTKYFLWILLPFFYFSCAEFEEENFDLATKEFVTVSLGSLKILAQGLSSNREYAGRNPIQYIEVLYGPYPEVVSFDPAAPSDRVLTKFRLEDYPHDFKIKVEKGKPYYVSIAAYSLAPNVIRPSAYMPNYFVSFSQLVLSPTLLRLKNDFFAFTEIFTAEDDDMVIDANLKRISAQIKLKMPDGIKVPKNAKKGQIRIRDTSVDYIGGIYFDLLNPGDIFDDVTFEFNLDLTSKTGIDTVFHILPISDSGPVLGTEPLQVAVKLFDELETVIAEGSVELDTIRFNRCYNFILDPNNTSSKAISIDIDENIEEVVDINVN